MTRTAGTHAYICECRNASCRERLYLKPITYTRLARAGTLLAKRCAKNSDSTILADYGLYVVALSTGSRIRVDRVAVAH